MSDSVSYVGKFIDDKFELIRKIGHGASSDVYEAIDVKQKRHVAIKMLKKECADNESLLMRFIKESRAFASLRHPNIISIYDVIIDGPEPPHIVMELADGEDLATYIARRGGKLSPTETVKISVQIASALRCVHDNGIIHRDVKPQNIIFTSENRIKLTDFGIAILSDDDIDAKKATSGTPFYMSPEQSGRSYFDHRTDIYALGVTMYQMVCGKLPFYSKSTTEVFGMHTYESPEKPIDVEPLCPIGLSEIIEKCMRKNMDERFEDCSVLSEHLYLLLNDINTFFGFEYSDSGIADTGALSASTLLDRFTPEPEAMPPQQKKNTSGTGIKPRIGKTNTAAIIILTMLLFLSIFLTAFFFVIRNSVTKESDIKEVYSVSGEYVGLEYSHSLIHRIEEQGYEIRATGVYGTEARSGIITEESKSESDGKSILTLTVALDDGEYLIPNLSGEPQEYVKTALDEKNIRYTVTRIFSPNIQKGYIVALLSDNDPIVSKNDSVTLLVSMGGGAKYTYIPNFTGLDLSEASKLACELGITLDSISFVFSDDAVKGRVISQNRVYGERVPVGYTSVQLSVSLGKS